MRTRQRDIHIMLNDEEYSALLEIQSRTGLILRELLINAISDKPFVTKEYISEVTQLKESLMKLTVELRRIGVNVNQLARVSNAVGDSPSTYELQEIKNRLEEVKETCDDLWQYSKQLIPRARAPTEH